MSEPAVPDEGETHRSGEAESGKDEAASTVGTGSVLGIGCLIAVLLLIVIAIAWRWSGGSW